MYICQWQGSPILNRETLELILKVGGSCTEFGNRSFSLRNFHTEIFLQQALTSFAGAELQVVDTDKYFPIERRTALWELSCR